MSNRLKQLLLLIGDIGVLYLSLYLTLFIRYGNTPLANDWGSHFLPFSMVFVGWILIFYIFNLYNLNYTVNNEKFLRLTGKALVLAGLTSLAFFYLNPNITIAPKRNMFIFIMVFVVLFFIWRKIYNRALHSFLPQNNVAIIGLNSLVTELINNFENKPHLGHHISFVVSASHGNDMYINKTPIYNSYGKLEELIQKKNINTIVLATDLRESNELRSILFRCLPLKITCINLPSFYEKNTGKIPLTVINQSWFLENLSEGNKNLYTQANRLYDLFFAVLLLVLTLPFWLIFGLIIKLESKGPVFFQQTRVGKHNRIFTLFKFRSMREENNDRSMTTTNDMRITKFGSFIRKTRIDEIPQLINIIKGEMSFVGPRPERPEIAENLEKEIPFYNERSLVKPGITGWDQISGEYHSPSKEDTIKKLQYDLFYIKNRSIYLDLTIMLKTIYTIINKEGV